MSPKNEKYLKFLFSPQWFYSVHSVLFSQIWSYSVLIGPFGLIQSTSVPSVHIDPVQSILSTLVLIRSTLVLFSPFCPLWPLQFYSVHFVYFSPIRSILFT